MPSLAGLSAFSGDKPLYSSHRMRALSDATFLRHRGNYSVIPERICPCIVDIEAYSTNKAFVRRCEASKGHCNGHPYGTSFARKPFLAAQYLSPDNNAVSKPSTFLQIYRHSSILEYSIYQISLNHECNFNVNPFQICEAIKKLSYFKLAASKIFNI